jgi:cardiolipin synthase
LTGYCPGYGKEDRTGAYLDPIADKTMLVAAFIMLSIKDAVPVWLTTLIIVKDFIIAVCFFILYRLVGSIEPVPSIFGKLTTTCQIATVLLVLLVRIFSWQDMRVYTDAFFFVTAFITVLSGCHYVYYGIRTLRESRAGKSPT